ncbi:Ysc84 actin-binding domain protein [Kalmanozyma brasiliensis GHG001]|uniref:Ysc84 actin-binding domain-containing protein n=1 Tax=Kalmanozyma brasiliensis (strain GHG001) TaxID=1365824 RepID=V5GPG3_KALBG|nr:Ysc84 actin-binding domain protein [Kalmanozyma brasiliensis GHG001]EST07857.1 Ysc84 actin-binding domain protein [Kalmanozyma brasiliensis GHG001]
MSDGPSRPAHRASPSTSSTEPGRWSRWGKTAFDKSIVVSDWASGYANAASAKMGGERFWPKSNDFPEEIAKCERILRAFTVEGIETKPSTTTSEEGDIVVEKDPKADSFVHKKRKVLRKIPPAVIKRAKGIVIYTAMRSGIAPFGGAGGAGLMLARLPDSSWSAPSSISPNNLAVGLLLGFDIFDVILVVNSDRAMESFKSHKVTLGAETAVAAGPFGAGISGEMGIDRSPVFSYVRSRGLYGGVEAMAQAFLHRFDENERIYYWPGVTARDILEGKVRKPPIVDPLYRALRDAETGIAQGDSLERTVYETVLAPPNKAVRSLAAEESAELLEDGERLKLPPTPEELEAMEDAGIPDEYDLQMEKIVQEEARLKAEQEKREIMALPPPPRHKKVVGVLQARGSTAPGKRRVAPPMQDGKPGRRVAPPPLDDGEKAEVEGDETVQADEEKMDLIDLDEPEKPALPVRPRHDAAVYSLADELQRSSLDGTVDEAKAINSHAVTETEAPLLEEPLETTKDVGMPKATAGTDGEPAPLVVAHSISEASRPSTPKTALPDLSGDTISRSSSLSRPSRPPRRAAATPTITTVALPSNPPRLRLFFDWDETITSHDTLSLIAPPEGEQAHGTAFSSYTTAYLCDLETFESTFGTRETWDRQLEFLGRIDEVERASVARVESGGLFIGMSKRSLLDRAEQVEFRHGWDAFYTWLQEQVETESVSADIISVGWSAEFIRHAIERAAAKGVIDRVYANQVEMVDEVATGKLTKSTPLSLDGELGGVRTGLDKLKIMQSVMNDGEVKVYVGDSATDLPCLVNADFGLIMKPNESFDESSIYKVIQRTGPPVKKLYREVKEFVESYAKTETEDKEGAVLVRVDDWTQALEVIQHIQEHVVKPQ